MSKYSICADWQSSHPRPRASPRLGASLIQPSPHAGTCLGGEKPDGGRGRARGRWRGTGARSCGQGCKGPPGALGHLKGDGRGMGRCGPGCHTEPGAAVPEGSRDGRSWHRQRLCTVTPDGRDKPRWVWRSHHRAPRGTFASFSEHLIPSPRRLREQPRFVAALPKHPPSSHGEELTPGCEAFPLGEVRPRAAGLSPVPPSLLPARCWLRSIPGWDGDPPPQCRVPPGGGQRQLTCCQPGASDGTCRFRVENQYL